MGFSRTSAAYRLKTLLPATTVTVVLLSSLTQPAVGQPSTCRVVVGPTPVPELTDANVQFALTIVRDLARSGEEFEVNELAFRFQATESGQSLRQRFDNVILNLKADGTYQTIFEGTPLQLIP